MKYSIKILAQKIMCIITLIIVPAFTITGCGADNHKIPETKKYSSQATGSALNYRNKTNVNDFDRVFDASIFNDKIIITGYKYFQESDHKTELIDVRNNDITELSCEAPKDICSLGTFTESDIYIICSEDIEHSYISRFDRSGNYICKADLPVNSVIQNLSAAEEYVYCLYCTENLDSSLNFTLNKYTDSLELIEKTDIIELFGLAEEQYAVSVINGSNGDIFIQVSSDDPQRFNKIFRVSSSMNTISEIDLTSEFTAGFPLLYDISEKGIITAAYDEENDILFENIYNEETFQLSEMKELKIPFEVDAVFFDLNNNDICYSIDNSLYGLDSDKKETLILEKCDGNQTTSFFAGKGNFILANSKEKIDKQMIVGIYGPDFMLQKKITLDPERNDIYTDIKTCALSENKLALICKCSGETGENKKIKVCILDTENEKTEWSELNEEFYNINDVYMHDDLLVFLSEKINSDSEISQELIFLDIDHPDTVKKKTSVSEEEFWNGIAVSAHDDLFLYNGRAVEKISDHTRREINFQQEEIRPDLIIPLSNSVIKIDSDSMSAKKYISDTSVEKCVLSNDNTPIYLSFSYSLGGYCLFRDDSYENYDKINVIMINEKNTYIRNTVEEFNQTNTGFKINLISVPDAEALFDYLINHSCDVLINCNVSDTDTIKSKIELCDLNDLSDLMDSKMIAGSLYSDSVMYGVYPEFTISGFTADHDVDISGINSIEKMNNYFDESNDLFICQEGKEEFIDTVFFSNLNLFVDSNSQNCSLAENGFDKILNISDSCITEKNDENISVVFEKSEIKNIKDYAKKKIYEKQMFVPDESSDCIIIPEYIFSVYSRSDHKNESMEVIKLFFNDEFQKKVSCFPVVRSAYNMNENNNNTVLDVFFNTIEKSKYCFENEEVRSIINEVLSNYFDGIYDINEVTEIIEKKLNLFLDETR